MYAVAGAVLRAGLEAVEDADTEGGVHVSTDFLEGHAADFGCFVGRVPGSVQGAAAEDECDDAADDVLVWAAEFVDGNGQDVTTTMKLYVRKTEDHDAILGLLDDEEPADDALGD